MAKKIQIIGGKILTVGGRVVTGDGTSRCCCPECDPYYHYWTVFHDCCTGFGPVGYGRSAGNPPGAQNMWHMTAMNCSSATFKYYGDAFSHCPGDPFPPQPPTPSLPTAPSCDVTVTFSGVNIPSGCYKNKSGNTGIYVKAGSLNGTYSLTSPDCNPIMWSKCLGLTFGSYSDSACTNRRKADANANLIVACGSISVKSAENSHATGDCGQQDTDPVSFFSATLSDVCDQTVPNAITEYGGTATITRTGCP